MSIARQGNNLYDPLWYGTVIYINYEEKYFSSSLFIEFYTKRANTKATRVFCAYLMECGDGTNPFDFEKFSFSEANFV